MTHGWGNCWHQSGCLGPVPCCLDTPGTELPDKAGQGVRQQRNSGQLMSFEMPGKDNGQPPSRLKTAGRPPSNKISCAGLTNLVNHVRQQAFNLIIVDPLLAAEADGGRKLGDRDAAAADRLLSILSFLETARDKYLPQEVAQRNIAAALQRQVDAPLDELVFPFLEGEVELVELAPLDASAERQEELL